MILFIQPENCTGCLACEVYCSLAHEGVVNLALSRIRVHKDENRLILVPVACIPCETKPCLQACSKENAIHLTERGAVVIEESLCTGCGRCARACEIGAIHFHRLSGRGKNGVAVSLKCDQCGGDPWCARVCPNGAIRFVEEDEQAARVFAHLRADLDALERKAAAAVERRSA